MAKYINNILQQCTTQDDVEYFLQSEMWGDFKSHFGWVPKTFTVEWAEHGRTSLLTLSRSLLPGISFTYIPWGPQLPPVLQPQDMTQILIELAQKLKQHLPRSTVFVRFDPPWQRTISKGEKGDGKGLRKAGVDVQAPDTVVIDLSVSCEEILAAMKPKWRYNISLAGKKGVKVEQSGDLQTFFRLMKETAARDGISIHSFNYYQTLFDLCSRDDGGSKIRLYIANHENDTLAAIMVLFRYKWATYLYGASSNNKRNLMAPYALQWQAMRDAKETGCKYYDLFGIPPDEDPNHPMAGLYRFKTGFGGQILRRPGCWDYPYKKLIYSSFAVAESLRKKLLNLKKNR